MGHLAVYIAITPAQIEVSMTSSVSPGPLAALLTLPANKIVRSEEDYLSSYEARCARLRAMRGEPGRLAETVESALGLTESCHEIANRIGEEIAAIQAKLARSDRTEDAISWDREVRARQPPIGDDFLDAWNAEVADKAYDFWRWAHAPEREGALLTDLLASRFGDDPEDKVAVEMVVISLNQVTKTIDGQRVLGEGWSMWAGIVRGLLYQGILGFVGSDLERKELAKRLQALCFDAVGHFIEGAGFLKSLAEFIGVYDVHKPLESVKGAYDVEQYLMKYTECLEGWKAASVVVKRPEGLELRTREKEGSTFGR